MLLGESEPITVKSPSKEASLSIGRAHEVRAELACKIALFIGPAESLATDITGLTLFRRTAPTAQLSVT